MPSRSPWEAVSVVLAGQHHNAQPDWGIHHEGASMSTYVDDDLIQNPRATIYAHEEQRSFKVTYRGEDGKKFSLRFVQKPNPIGFMAKLPGSRK